jgi:cytochrome c oxidase assembly factor CtaG
VGQLNLVHRRIALRRTARSPALTSAPLRRRQRSSIVLLTLGAVAALAVTTSIALMVGAAPYRELGDLGDGDPGGAVRLGVSVLRLLSDSAACMCVGSLAFALLFSRPDSFDGFTNILVGRGYRAVRAAARWAAVWALAAAGCTVFSAASDAGLHLGEVPSLAAWLDLIRSQEEPLGWLVSVGAAIVVAAAAAFVQQWRSSALVLGLAVLALLPPLFGGHSSSEAGHDYALAAIMIHVPAATIWVGLVVVGFRELCRRPPNASAIVRRLCALTPACWIAVVASGLIDAGVLNPGFRLDSSYGRTLGAVTAIAAVLALAAIVVRRRAALSVERFDETRSLRWQVGTELVLLALAFGASAESSQLTPPALHRSIPVSLQQTLLGYDLPKPPSAIRLAFDWRIEVLFTAAAAAAAGWYAVAVLRLRRADTRWPWRRTASWLAGCLVLIVATSSGVGRYEPALFSIHMASHMLVGFVVPTLLALGGPLTLARRSGRPTPSGLPGASEWIDLLEATPLTRFVTHPLAALGLLVGTPFVIYFGGVFDAAARFHWAHIGLDSLFLGVGYVFAWVVVGVDPLPRPLPNLARLGMLIAAAPFCAVFAGLVITDHRVIGNGLAAGNMYSALLLWPHSLLKDQRLGGVIALVIGDATLFAALVVLLVRWRRGDDDWEHTGTSDANAAAAEQPDGAAEPEGAVVNPSQG